MTYSIVAHDEVTGEFGAAVQSHFFAAGAHTMWAKAGVGAVVTQAAINPMYGEMGLEYMADGSSAEDALNRCLAQDPVSDRRQVAIVDNSGTVAVHTGAHCLPHACQAAAAGVSAQANVAGTMNVAPAMVDAFLSTRAPLMDRLLAALEAGESAGGDLRGRQAAALLVVGGASRAGVDANLPVDLRVDDHPSPLEELRRLADLHRGSELLWAAMRSPAVRGGAPVEPAALSTVLDLLVAAQQIQGANLEPTFWRTVALLRADRLDEARPGLQELRAQSERWIRLLSLVLGSRGRNALDQIS